jgi:hypothetical protein
MFGQTISQAGLDPAPLGLGRPGSESAFGAPVAAFNEPIPIAWNVRGWRSNKWRDLDGPTMRLWDLWEVLPAAGMRVAKLLLGTVVEPLWKIVCEAALRDQPGRVTVNVKPTLSPGAKFVFVYIGDHNCIGGEPGDLLAKMEGQK